MATTFNPFDPSTADPSTIAAGLLGTGLTLVPGSVSYQGAADQASTFSGAGATLGIDSGLLLTSGSGTPAITNTTGGFSRTTGSGSDADLLAAAAGIALDVNDANTLSFAVVAGSAETKSITFSFVFGSEEFPEFSSQFSDIAAIIVNGVNIAKFANGNALAVIDENLAAGNFQDNQDGHIAIEYDGISTKLSVTVELQDGENTIKLGVADSNDSNLDAGFFVGALEAGTGGGGTITQPPIAEDDIASTGVGTPVTVAVLANDSDPDGTIASYLVDTVPANGTAAFNSDGTLTYTPGAGFTGTDTLTYKIFDNDGASDTAVLSINVGAIPSTCPIIDRPGTQDGSASTDDVLTGPPYHNTFFVAEAGVSGHDRITNFAKDDVFATSKA
ncbi:choice-of-anchor L domain-containing protein, partial [Mesorhizobium delmotii]|uniref:choice-of-anchor L domain-containing protein n=1 Tax=Mesorhizobium delmotii TaxID=1631247 RepID=UPI001AD7E973